MKHKSLSSKRYIKNSVGIHPDQNKNKHFLLLLTSPVISEILMDRQINLLLIILDKIRN